MVLWPYLHIHFRYYCVLYNSHNFQILYKNAYGNNTWYGGFRIIKENFDEFEVRYWGAWPSRVVSVRWKVGNDSSPCNVSRRHSLQLEFIEWMWWSVAEQIPTESFQCADRIKYILMWQWFTFATLRKSY